MWPLCTDPAVRQVGGLHGHPITEIVVDHLYPAVDVLYIFDFAHVGSLDFDALSVGQGRNVPDRATDGFSAASADDRFLALRARWAGSRRSPKQLTTSDVVQVFGRRRHQASRYARRAGVQKASRHEVAGSLGPGGQPALWGFDFRADYDGGREAGARRPG